MDVRVFGFPARASDLSVLHCPDWPWDLLTLLSTEYRGFFPRGQNSWGVKLTTSSAERLSMRGAIPPLPHTSMALCLFKHRGNFTVFTHRTGWFRIRVWEVQFLVFGRYTGHQIWFSQSLQANAGVIPRLSRNRFLSNSSFGLSIGCYMM
jgi:hypothetical protein